MSSIKISQLIRFSSISSEDFIPLVDSSSLTTYHSTIETFNSWSAASGSSFSSISASYAVSASRSEMGLTASYAISSSKAQSGSYSETSSYAWLSPTSSFAITTSYAYGGSVDSSSYALTSSMAWTSSHALVASSSITASFALAIQTQGASIIPGVVPIGTLIDFAGITNPDPTIWAICSGSAVSRTGIYVALFAVIGETWGAGDTTTTFNLPDLRKRMSLGAFDMPAAADVTPPGSASWITGSVGTRAGGEWYNQHYHCSAHQYVPINTSDMARGDNPLFYWHGRQIKTPLRLAAPSIGEQQNRESWLPCKPWLSEANLFTLWVYGNLGHANFPQPFGTDGSDGYSPAIPGLNDYALLMTTFGIAQTQSANYDGSKSTLQNQDSSRVDLSMPFAVCNKLIRFA